MRMISCCPFFQIDDALSTGKRIYYMKALAERVGVCLDHTLPKRGRICRNIHNILPTIRGIARIAAVSLHAIIEQRLIVF